MNPRHHLDQATLVSYAAGALSAGMAAVAATHLEACRHCRHLLGDAERVGGLLLGQQQPAAPEPARSARLRQAMLDCLDETPVVPAAATAADGVHAPADPDLLPAPLRPYFGASWRALRWRWMAPGVQMIRAAVPTRGDTLILLKIAPGKSMPVHSHAGSELTQVLQGAYDDVLGHFAPGDAADLDSAVQHQPVTAPGVPCVCVAALDAPLRFPGWLARRLQPLVGL